MDVHVPLHALQEADRVVLHEQLLRRDEERLVSLPELVPRYGVELHLRSKKNEKRHKKALAFTMYTHMGKGGDKKGGSTPREGQKQVPSLHQKNGRVPITKQSLIFSTSMPPFLGLFYCACLFFQSN